MHLMTDEQTITDLGIFGRQQAGGVFDLYNHTHTRGGEAILQDLFMHPLASAPEINRRRGIIQHFAQLKVTFPFKAAAFDMAEKYLDHADEQSTLSEKDIQQGVAAIIELLQQLAAFIDSAPMTSLKGFEREQAAIALLLSDPALIPVLAETGKLSFTGVTAFDMLFRLQHRAHIRSLLEYIYYLDVYISVAATAVQRGFVFPTAVTATGVLKLTGVYHPLLTTPVGNDVVMNSSKNVVFLTGANMAGKSTFLRALSMAVYIAHIGFPVAALAMEFSVMDGIYTTINLPDNLGMGASHFYNEVLRVKKVALALSQGKSLFVVFDELFRGTNVKDAHEATVAVTGAFSDKQSSLFVISSHIVEAGEDLMRESGVEFLYLPTHMNGHVPSYTYKLEPGITADRHGMTIIQNEGILDTLRKKNISI